MYFKKVTSSLIISTYNWPKALFLCLQSVLKQKVAPNEIIIADDGSNEDTKKVIDYYKSISKIPIIHVWQVDEGFQLAKIRNKAIAKASFDYIIQIDGDLILHSYFVNDHIKNKTKNQFIRASRVRLGKDLSEKILKNPELTFSIFNKNVKSKFNGLRNSFISKLSSKKSNSPHNMLGCNMSYWKEDALKVNGYKNNMVGWGHEDEEFAARLINLGNRKLKLKNNAIAYHIYHKERVQLKEDEHRNIINKVIQNKTIATNDGIKQL